MMRIKDFLVRTLMTYFTIVTLITVAILVLGLKYDPGAKLGYDAFISPLLFGAVGVIPSCIMYSRKELSLRQMMIRKAIMLVLIEGIVLAIAWDSPMIHIEKPNIFCGFVLCIAVIYFIANGISWLQNCKTAKHLNDELLKWQQNHKN